jgi:hypothetical protein
VPEQRKVAELMTPAVISKARPLTGGGRRAHRRGERLTDATLDELLARFQI